MRFVDKKESFTITYKAHEQDVTQHPFIAVYRQDGAVYASGVMTHIKDGLYTFALTAPNEDCYLAALVDATGGAIVVGVPKVTKLFYYDSDPESTHYEIRDPKTLNILQQGEMFSLGNHLYVITTTLDGTVQVIAGKREGAAVMLPLRRESITPADSVRIIGEFNKLDTRMRDRR